MNRETIAKHFGESWVDFMAPFADSPAMDNILAALKNQKAEGHAVWPQPANVFRAFRETPLPDVRVVIMGQDPYPNNFATGIAFGDESGVAPESMPPSLKKIIDAVEKDAYGGLNLNKANFDRSFKHWCSQGVLMLNAALTVIEKNPGVHAGLWKPFMEFFIEQMRLVKKDIIYCPWGGNANEIISNVFVFSNFPLPKCEHPSAAAREKRDWVCNHFSMINATITAHRHLGNKIEWIPQTNQ